MKKSKLIAVIFALVMIVAVLFCLNACDENDESEPEYEWIAGRFIKIDFWYNGMYVSRQEYEFTLNGGFSLTVSGIANNQHVTQSLYGNYLLEKGSDYIYFLVDGSDTITALHYCGTYIETDYDRFEFDGANGKGEMSGRIVFLTYRSDSSGHIDGRYSQCIAKGENGKTVTAVAAQGYEFVQWSDGVETAMRTDSNVTENIDVTAEFRRLENVFMLQYSAEANGKIEGEVAQTVAANGNGSTVTAIPNEGYVFDKWSDGVTTPERTDLNVSEDISVTAIFKQAARQYTLQYTAATNGRIEGTCQQTVAENENGSEVTAIPDEGYEFDRWSDGVTTAERMDLNVNSDMTVMAIFKIEEIYEEVYYAVKFDFGYDDKTSEMRVLKDSKIELTEPSRLGYEFKWWTKGYYEQLVSGDVLEITGDTTLRANWQIVGYSITYELNGGTLDNPRITFTINSLPLNLQMPDSEDETCGFAKWTTDEEGENTITIIEKSESNLKDFTLYAHYEDSSKFMTFSYDAQTNGYALTGYSGNAKKVVIPSSYNGIAVTNIDDSVFSGCSGLTSITIPDSVTSIGSCAFALCSGLTSITIPDSVTSIGSNAFEDCSGLTSITIPDNVTSIGYCVFSGCSGLTSITIPDSITIICDDAFKDCSGLTSVTIPDSVTYIRWGAFRGCVGLTNVAIPDSVMNIGTNAFKDCTALETVYVSSSAVADTTFHNLFDNAKDVYILDTIELNNSLFDNLYERQCESVVVDGKSYIHYVYKF